MSEFDLTKPQSRSEKILGKMTKDYSGELDPPQSRVEAYLSKLSEGGGGTGGGSSDGDYVTISLRLKGNINDFMQKMYIITKNKINSITELNTLSDLYTSGYYVALSFGNSVNIFLPKSNDMFFVYSGIKDNDSKVFRINKFIPDKDKIVEIDNNVKLYGFSIYKIGYPYKSNIEWDLGDEGCQNEHNGAPDNNTKLFTMNLTTGKPDYGIWEKDEFFMPRSCMLRSDGTVAYYLDETDETKKEDGTPSDVGNPDFDGNAMMEFGRDGKLIWTKVEPTPLESGRIKVFIADRQLDDNYHAWAFHDANGKLVPHFYMPKYNSTLINGKYRSLSGQRSYSDSTPSLEEINNYAKANGSGWFTETKAQLDLINMLLMLMSKNTHLDDIYGKGVNPDTVDPGQLYKTGYTNGKGMFYGTSNNIGVKVFGMENWWGKRTRLYAGHMMIDGVQKVKLTYGTEDGSTVVGYNTTGDGYISLDGVTLSGGDTVEDEPTIHYGQSRYFAGIDNRNSLVPAGVLSSGTSGDGSYGYGNLIYYNNTGVEYAIHGLYDMKDGSRMSSMSISLSHDVVDNLDMITTMNMDVNITCTPAINELDIEDKYVKPEPV